MIQAPMPAIELNATAKGAQDRSGMMLVVFMRLVAALWLVEGLSQWAFVLSSDADGRSGLVTLAPPALIAAVFFALINLIAAVGLWLATPWGGVIWLVTAGAQLFVIATIPSFFAHPMVTAPVDAALVLAYLVLSWREATARERLGTR